MLEDIRVGMSFGGVTKEELSELELSLSYEDNDFDFYYDEVIIYSGYKKQVWLADSDLSELESDIKNKFTDNHDQVMNELKIAITDAAYNISVSEWNAGSEVVQIAYDNKVSVMPSPGELYGQELWEEVEVIIMINGDEHDAYLEGEMYDADDGLQQMKVAYDELREDNGITDYAWNPDLSKQFIQIWKYSTEGYSMEPGEGLNQQTGEDFVQGF